MIKIYQKENYLIQKTFTCVDHDITPTQCGKICKSTNIVNVYGIMWLIFEKCNLNNTVERRLYVSFVIEIMFSYYCVMSNALEAIYKM